MKSTLLFLCVVSVVVITEACKCFLSHPQTNFCRSDYGMWCKLSKKLSNFETFLFQTTQLSNVYFDIKVGMKYKPLMFNFYGFLIYHKYIILSTKSRKLL